MSLLTQAALIQRYGPRLSVDDLADVMKISRATINNQISDGSFPIATYRAHGKRWADFQDVDAYLEQCREAAVVGA
jgi:hypothetical protein